MKITALLDQTKVVTVLDVSIFETAKVKFLDGTVRTVSIERLKKI